MATTNTVAQIDQATLARKLENCIAKFPVRVRHLGREFQARLNATTDIAQLMDGGILDNMSIQVIAPKGKFADRLPQSMQDFDILVNNIWKTFQIRDVPDFYDTLSPSFTINLQSPNKGIE
jgi:hypothetical protein